MAHTYTELGYTFDSSLLDEFANLVRSGYKPEQVKQRLAVEDGLFQAVVQAYFSENQD
jgi:hypothetical protein